MATTKITTPDLFDLSTVNTALRLPNGSTANRPSSPSNGEWRYNTTLKYVEYYDSGTASWYQIDTEGIAPDALANFQTSTYTGTGAANTIASKFDQAGYFNGSTSKIEFSSNPVTWGTSDYTITFWFNASAIGTNYTAFIGTYTSSGWSIDTGPQTNKIRFYFDGGAGGSVDLTTTSTISLNTWYHVAVSMDHDSIASIYLNGILENSQTGSDLGANTGGNVIIGKNPNMGNPIAGAMDQFRIFNSALDSTEILYIKNNESATTAAELNPSSWSGSVPATCVAAYQLDGNGNDVSGSYNSSSTTDMQYVGTNFTPDFVWTKTDTAANNHYLFDSVRGPGYEIYSDITDGQFYNAATLTSFDAKGFSLGTGSGVNNAFSRVAWQWRAGGAPSATNTQSSGAMDADSVSLDGVLQSAYTPSGSPTYNPKKMSINTEAGFSIIRYDGTGADATIPHGLSSAPEIVIVKRVDTPLGGNWVVGETAANSFSDQLFLNSDAAKSPGTYFLSTNPTANVFTVRGASADVGASGGEYVAYCFHSVTGYLKVGSYSGDNTTSNTQTVGFQPSWLLVKRTDDTGHWNILDNKRNTSNPRNSALEADTNVSQQTSTNNNVNFNSDNFEIATNDAAWNASGGTYFYIAIA